MHSLMQKFRRYDGPTWIVALVLYGAWVLLIWFNPSSRLIRHHSLQTRLS